MFLSVPLFADFALKLVLNAITTGANIIKGRVYGNTMITLQWPTARCVWWCVQVLWCVAVCVFHVPCACEVFVCV